MRPALLVALLVASPLVAQDGTVYRPSMSPLSYALTKSALSGSAYLVGRELGLSRTVAAVTAIVAPWVAGKAVALHQGHRVPWQDAVGDLAFHALLVLPVATKRVGWSVVTVSVIVVTCARSSPRTC